MPTKMLPSPSGTVPERSVYSPRPHCPGLGLSLYEGHCLKLFYRHLGHVDAENIQGCGRKGSMLQAYNNTAICLIIQSEHITWLSFLTIMAAEVQPHLPLATNALFQGDPSEALSTKVV